MWFYEVDRAVQEIMPAEWHAQIFLNSVSRKESIEVHLFTTQADGLRYRTDYEVVQGDNLSTFLVYNLTPEDCEHIASMGKIITESNFED
jgi:hypothetical protein